MAFTHIYFNEQNTGNVTHGRNLRSALTYLKNGRSDLMDLRDIMITMIDGDTAVAGNYGEVVARFGFVDTTAAKAAFDEISSALGKLTTDASQTSVQAALLQLFNKLG